MQTYLKNNQNTVLFSQRKIPIKGEQENNNFSISDIDKIKIIELSNIIDEWEQEILFAENGFYSIKGKDIQNKSTEFILELEDFINKKISEISFSDLSSRDIAIKIKKDKISAIKKEMKLYEIQELKNWESNVYEDAIKSAINRAIKYKSDDDVILSSLNNGLSIIRIMAEKENWSSKLHKHKEQKYKSEFYFSLINSLIKDKDAKAYTYFNQNKDLLEIEEKEKLENSIKELKNNVIAYNWAKELFSYKLSEKEQEEEINNLKDSEIEKYVRQFLSDFSKTDKIQKEEREKEQNIINWQDIIKMTEQDVDKAYLYIDFCLKPENIKSKKEYIKQIKKDGFISTNRKKFIDLLLEFFEDFEKFKKLDISDYHACLSQEDYSLFDKLKKLQDCEFNKMKFDYNYILKKQKALNLKTEEEKYSFAKLLIYSFEEYKLINKKDADIEARNKIIEAVIGRYTENKK